MENSAHALLIVAGTLIGLIIISLGISLDSSLSGYVEQSQQEIINRDVQQFNEQFIKYINCESYNAPVDFVLTIQDVVTAANAARENNNKYGLNAPIDNNFYVRINMSGYSQLEDEIDTNLTTILEDKIDKQYRCRRADVEINPVTGRVCEVTFSEISVSE